MPLNKNQKQILQDAGFLKSEIFKIGHAKTPDGKAYQKVDLDTGTWQAVINSRRRWIKRRLAQGWTRNELINSMRLYYRKRKGRDIWAFLKIEYRPTRRLSDFQFAIKLRDRARISKRLGRDYGRRMYPQRRPRNG